MPKKKTTGRTTDTSKEKSGKARKKGVKKDPFQQLISGLKSIEKHGSRLDSYAELVHKHEKAVLDELLDVLRPIVRYLDDEIPIRETWMAGRLGGSSAAYPERGMVLVNNFSSQNDPQNEKIVNFTGYKVILTRTGRLVKVSRTGVWKKTGGEDSFWSIESLEIPVTEEFAKQHLQEVVESVMHHIAEARDMVQLKKREMEARLNLIKDVRKMLDARVPSLREDETQRVELGADQESSETDSSETG